MYYRSYEGMVIYLLFVSLGYIEKGNFKGSYLVGLLNWWGLGLIKDFILVYKVESNWCRYRILVFCFYINKYICIFVYMCIFVYISM